MTKKRKLYLFFLIASNLSHLKKADVAHVTSTFELASYHALDNYLPIEKKLYMFGKHSLNNGRYTGRLWDKLNKMAKDIGEEVRCKKSNFKPRDTGDAGLDLISWIPLEQDTNISKGFLLIFGQCACGEDWVTKQNDTIYEEWIKVISLTTPPARFTFIPYCYRQSTGDWYNDLKIWTILIDRVRIIRLLRGKQSKLETHIVPYIHNFIDNAIFPF